MGNYKQTSDLDLQIIERKVSQQTLTRLYGKLNEEVSVPFTFDIVGESVISELQQHIDQHGFVLYLIP